MIRIRVIANLVSPNECISCGICKKKCPAGAVRLIKGGKPSFLKRCVACETCVILCPKSALNLKKVFY